MFLSERCKHASQSKAPVHCKVLYAVLACNAKCNLGSRMRQLQPAKKLFFANQMNTRVGTRQAGGGERGDGEVDGCGEIPALVGHAEPDASAYPNQPGRKPRPAEFSPRTRANEKMQKAYEQSTRNGTTVRADAMVCAPRTRQP